jgi:hypothetical protein
VSLVMPHINVVFSTVDSASQRRLNDAFNSCLRYVHYIPRWEHVSHLVPTIIGVCFVVDFFEDSPFDVFV